jgi:hypothetical protein
MKLVNSKKRVALVVALVVVAVSAVGAYAYWTSNGTGNGSAATLNPTTAQLSVDSLSSVTGLYPGGSQNFTGVITNNASYNIAVTSLAPDTVAAADSSGVVVDSSAGTCAADTNFSIGNLKINGVAVPLGTAYEITHGTTVAISGTINMIETHANQDGCMNAALTYYLKAS